MIQNIKDFLEIKFWQFAKYLIIKGYGANCETCDLDDFREMYKEPKDVFYSGRCSSCRAKEVCVWIDSHIELLRM